MKKNLFITVICLLLLLQVACGQNTPDNTESKATNTTETKKDEYPNLKIQANEVGKATLEKDYAKVLDYTHPKILEMGGGKEKILAAMKQGSEMALPEGFELLAVDINEPSQIEKIENQIFAILPMKLTINSPEGKFMGESYLVGISDDGKSWKFISGTGKESFRTIFPKAADVLNFPEQKPPKKLDS